MKRFLILGVLVAAFVSPAYADVAAGTPTYNWVQPLTWSDATPLTAAQITGYQLTCTGVAPVSRRITAAAGVPPSLTPTANRLAPGAYSCTLAVYARKTTTDPEVMGTASNAVSFTVPQPTPGAPTGFSAD